MDSMFFLLSFSSCAAQLAYSKGFPVSDTFLSLLSYAAVDVFVHAVSQINLLNPQKLSFLSIFVSNVLLSPLQLAGV